MNTNKLPKTVEIAKLATEHAKLVGQINQNDLARLAGADCLSIHSDAEIASVTCEIDFLTQLFFGDRHYLMHGQLNTQLLLICQRCLQSFLSPLKRSFKLCSVSSLSKIDQIPDGYEPVILEAKDKLNVWECITDEILLSIPIVAMHPADACTLSEPQKMQIEQNNSPFAVLKNLLS